MFYFGYTAILHGNIYVDYKIRLIHTRTFIYHFISILQLNYNVDLVYGMLRKCYVYL